MGVDTEPYVNSGHIAEALGCENADRAFLAAVEKLKADLAQSQRQVTDLQAANSRYLQRARDAEAKVIDAAREKAMAARTIAAGPKRADRDTPHSSDVA